VPGKTTGSMRPVWTIPHGIRQKASAKLMHKRMSANSERVTLVSVMMDGSYGLVTTTEIATASIDDEQDRGQSTMI